MVPRFTTYPDAAGRCFCLILTVSTGEFPAIFAPTAGIITYRDGLLLRQAYAGWPIRSDTTDFSTSTTHSHALPLPSRAIFSNDLILLQ